MEVEYLEDREFEWRLELPPCQKSIRRVPGQPSALIRIDDWICVIPVRTG